MAEELHPEAPFGVQGANENIAIAIRTVRRKTTVNEARRSARVISWRWIRKSEVANSRSPSAMSTIPVPITDTPISVGVSRREMAAIEMKLMARRRYCSPVAMARARLTTVSHPVLMLWRATRTGSG